MQQRSEPRRRVYILAAALAAACGGDDGPSEAGTGGGTAGTIGSDSSTLPGGSDDDVTAPADTTAGADGLDSSSDGGGPPPPGDAAAGISLVRVVVNQAVDIDLIDDGQPTTEAERAAPIIGGRGALVRVEYALAPDFLARPVTARLWLLQADGTNVVYEDTRNVSSPGDMTTLGGTFTWMVEADALDGDTEFRVELLEEEGAEPVAGDTSGATVPSEGFAPVLAWGDRMVLDLVVVPFSCDGFGEVEITPEDLSDFEAYLFNTYPVQEINIEVHDVVASASCSEFDAAEFDLPELRENEGAQPWVYYGGLLPGDGGGYSISTEGGDQMDYRRTFANNTWRWYGLTFDLFAHELGHNHGRNHSFDDAAFPGDASGNCGSRTTFGWGVVGGSMPNSGFSNDIELGIEWIDPHEQLLAPTDDTCDGLPNANEGNLNDFMSYAYPYWISAYTYAALADRVRLLSTWRESEGPSPEEALHRVIVDPEGFVSLTRRSAARAVVASSDGVARCQTSVVPVHRGRAVRESFVPDREATVFEYTTFEFDSRAVLPCAIESYGETVVVEETAAHR